jgi:hypothetical protein
MIAGTQYEHNQQKWVRGICEGKVPITTHTLEALQRRRTRLLKLLKNERDKLELRAVDVTDHLDFAAMGLRTRLLESGGRIEELAGALLELNSAEGFVVSYLEATPPTELAV